LMAAAYFVGAALACMIRRSSSAVVQPSAVERRVDPLPEVVRHGAEAARFGRVTEPARAPRSAAPAPAASPAQPPAASPTPARVADTSPQDLKRIRLIDATVEASLNKLGINRYELIAAWMQADVQRIDQALADKGRVNRENWIEQAQILAKGGETHYSARHARGEAASAAPTPDEGQRGPPAPAAPLPRAMSRAGVAAVVVAPPLTETRPAAPPSPPLVAERAAFARRQRSSARATEDEAEPETNALDVVAPAVPVRPAASTTQDNLQRIGGVTPEIERALNARGVSRYSQIAQWAPADVERFDKQLLSGGRIARENWVEQAQILSRGGDTRFSREFDRPPRPIKLPDAIREQRAAAKADGTRTDLGSLRSVRSEAYQNAPEPGPEAAQRVAAQNRVKRGAAPDDLKRIRGIGVLIEKRLGSLGVSSYEQIANWTAQDIERVSQSLDFKGRIERENWVEQARILASGGTTEFSRRVDRGEVETSRAKT
jgi:predicted flap endonuclease-1-like 5' DNA nuclease